MKFEECKVGDTIINTYNVIRFMLSEKRPEVLQITVKRGKCYVITSIYPKSKTIEIREMDTGDTINLVLPVTFEIAPAYPNKFSMSDALHSKPITRPQTSDYKLDFEVCREGNELSAYYHGVKLATVRCHPDDTYDEEFGLHILLRRACLKLKDEHTVVETVEELLQKP